MKQGSNTKTKRNTQARRRVIQEDDSFEIESWTDAEVTDLVSSLGILDGFEDNFD
jgi:hypothetical protein